MKKALALLVAGLALALTQCNSIETLIPSDRGDGGLPQPTSHPGNPQAFYDQGYADGRTDAQEHMDGNLSNRLATMNQRHSNFSMVEAQYRKGYNAGYGGAGDKAAQQQYSVGYNYGQRDRNGGLSNHPNRHVNVISDHYGDAWHDGYSDGYSDRSPKY
jgi:hypothetical protein